MKALVTGATGFIGRRLALELVRRGHEVTCLVRRTSYIAPLRGFHIKLVVGDLGDPASLPPAVAGQDYVFHLAGAVQALDEPAFVAANVQGTRNLVDACLCTVPSLRRFVFVSSIAAAGPSAPGKPICEDDEPRPVSAYGRSKLAAERTVLDAGARLPVTIIRPPNVLGPGSKDLGRAIGLLQKRIVPDIGANLSRTSLVDVDDLVEALLLAAEHPRSLGQIFFVTDGRAYAWPEITAAIAEELGVGPFRVQVPFGAQILAARLAEVAARMSGRPPLLTREIIRAGHDYSWVYDGSKIGRELGFRPRYSMRESVRRAVKAVRATRRSEAGQGTES